MANERTEPAVVTRLRAHTTVPVWPDAAEALGCGRHGAYRACREGTVRYIQVGRKWRVVSPDLLRLIGLE